MSPPEKNLGKGGERLRRGRTIIALGGSISGGGGGFKKVLKKRGRGRKKNQKKGLERERP